MTLNFSNKRCLLLGSAPGAFIPEAYESDIVIAANGAVGLTKHHVDVLVTTAYLCRPNEELKPHEIMSIFTWGNRHFNSVWVDVTGGPLDNVKNTLKKFDATYDDIWPYNWDTREEIVKDASGLNLGKGDVAARVSTGFFALCLLTLHEPSEICITGLGFQNGHYNKSWGTATKYHAPADKRCLTALVKRYKYFVTTSEELNEQFNIPKISL